MNAKIKTNYQIEIGEYRLDLTKDQAMELLSVLQKELAILLPREIKREETINLPRRFPELPAYFEPICPMPKPYEIWCGQPSSTCSL